MNVVLQLPHAEIKPFYYNSGVVKEKHQNIVTQIVLVILKGIGIIFYIAYLSVKNLVRKSVLESQGVNYQYEFAELSENSIKHQVDLSRQEIEIKMNDKETVKGTYFKHNDNKTRKTVIISNNAAVVANENSTEFNLCSLLNNDLDVIIYDYRGSGKSTGRASKEKLIEDCDAVCGYANQRLNIPDENIVLFGHCFGGAVSLHVAEKRSKASLILDRTFSSTEDLVKGQMKYRFRSEFIAKLISKIISHFGWNFDNIETFSKLKNEKILMVDGANDLFLGNTQLSRSIDRLESGHGSIVSYGIYHCTSLEEGAFEDFYNFLYPIDS